jgi:peptide-methionine (S)-S-oxide reductase
MSFSTLCRLTMALVATAVLAGIGACAQSNAEVAQFPEPPSRPEPTGKLRTAVFAGGCFWGIEAVFEHVKGVKDVVSGYAGGTKSTADYSAVSSGNTQHAEAVRVEYDPAQVSYGQLLKVFFSVAHDPTQLNRQGPDVGTQYRSAIFYADADEQRFVRTYIDDINATKIFSRPIVTEVAPLKEFYIAERYHQDYAAHNPNQPYIVLHDAPKVAKLKQALPELYTDG